MNLLSNQLKKYFILFQVLLVASCTPNETDFILPVPLALEATDVRFTSFTANWEASLGVDTYILEVAEDENFIEMLSGFPIQINQVTSTSITGLKDGTVYFYRLRGVFNGSNTEYSKAITPPYSIFSR